MNELRDEIWSWNLFAKDSSFPFVASYEPLSRHLFIFWAWACPFLLLAFFVLVVLEYLDARSGIALAERIKKLLWK
ncbi:MAG TPA: hypothetical protein VIW67_07310 [Terriglobales bacterium]|jgi:hypothetical protein